MTPFLADPDVTLYHGDAGVVLATLPDASVDCVVTSPPYFGLRDYGYDGQIGLEDTPAAFVARLVDVFREVRRVLSPSGVCWVNMGDSYAAGKTRIPWDGALGWSPEQSTLRAPGAKPKDLLGIPWRLAFGLQDDGWWLRSDVIWAKPNPMPESVTDRPTKAHEYLFLLTRSPRYYWDAEGVREPSIGQNDHDLTGPGYAAPGQTPHTGTRTKNRTVRPGVDTNGGGQGSGEMTYPASGRNVRSVWTFPTEPNPEAHFATFPRELVRRCLAAGCPERVCATCGEPSVRVVEKVRTLDGAPLPDDHPRAFSKPDEPFRVAPNGVGHWRYATSTTDQGWSDCGHDNWRPGVALDPFIGSGTTAVVARAMGRRTVGIDGSEEYLEIARKRTQQLSLLGGAA